MAEPMQDPVSPPPPPSYIPPAPSISAPGLAENIAALLAYITIIPAIIFLLIEPYNRITLVRFHSFQSIALSVAAFVIQIGLAIAQSFLHVIPGSWILFMLLNLVVGVGIFIAWIVVMIKAYQGQIYKLPVIGDWAEAQARR
jgi:uncharacterized membrane protein